MSHGLAQEAASFEQYNTPAMDWETEGAGDSPQRRFMSRAINLTAKEAARKVLDVGCGTGWFLAECLAKGAREATGIEPSNLASLAEKLVSEATVRQETFAEYQAPEGAYDLISFIMSTEHMPDLRNLLTKAKRLLQPDGTLLIMTADFDAFQMERFGYVITKEVSVPGKEIIVRTERPTSFGTTTDFVRTTDFWFQTADEVGLLPTAHTPVCADDEYVAKVPKYELFKAMPFMQVFRFKNADQTP